MHRVSVLIPAYNASATIEKAIISVLNQTEQNFEIIVIDDCSTDKTAEITNAFCMQDSRIQYYRLASNQGRSRALNLGTERSTGKWIAVLDADDWYAPERLKNLLDIADAKSVQMVADNQIFVDTKAQKICGTAFYARGRKRYFSLKEFLIGSNPLSPFDYGMLKPIVLAKFIKENKSINYYGPARNGQDFYYLLSFFAAGGAALIIDDAYYYYAQPFGSFSRSNRQHADGHYNFELIKQVNDHFIEVYKNQFSRTDINHLVKRGRSLNALISFHLIRSHLESRSFKKLFIEMYQINFEFLKLISTRLMKRYLMRRNYYRVFLND